MKKKLIGVAIVVAIAVAAGWNFNQSKNEMKLSELGLANVDALAGNEDGNGSSDNKFRYTDSMEDCTVYVGGAMAKGKKVNCWEGNQHPICADCRL